MEQHGAAPPRPAKPGRVERAERGARPGRPARPAQAPLVTLDTPRPETERTLNTYVEAPPRPPPTTTHHHHHHHQQQQQQQHQQHQQQHHLPQQHQQQQLNATADKHHLLLQHHQQPQRQQHQLRHQAAPVTAQPSIKRPQPCTRPLDSILCAQCGCCRCAQCAHPRPLPSRWLGSSCLCSAETAIDYTSCMCCVKALFYHCCNESGEESAACADEPCSCTGGRRGQRWGCLVALAFALPCLLCYWPLRGTAALCAGAYARVSHTGCRCAPHNLAPAPPIAQHPY